MNHVTAVVLAAGEGRRMGTARAKSYLDIAGRPLVLRTLDRMFASPRIENVILVVSAADFERCQTMLRSDPALKDRAWILQTGGVSPECLIEATPDRARLREIQTPQVFARDLILTAHAKAARDRIECTDDAMVVERFGKPVFVVEGETTNIKVTVPEDLWFAEALLRQGRIA
jgi:2-C-methyl-D-erythritol 4-phosphate cytidylyltransferase